MRRLTKLKPASGRLLWCPARKWVGSFLHLPGLWISWKTLINAHRRKMCIAYTLRDSGSLHIYLHIYQTLCYRRKMCIAYTLWDSGSLHIYQRARHTEDGDDCCNAEINIEEHHIAQQWIFLHQLYTNTSSVFTQIPNWLWHCWRSWWWWWWWWWWWCWWWWQ